MPNSRTLISVVLSLKDAYSSNRSPLKSSLLQGGLRTLGRPLPGCEGPQLVKVAFFHSRRNFCLFCLSQDCPLLWGFFLSNFHFSLQANLSKNSCNLVVFVGRDEFRVRLCCHFHEVSMSILLVSIVKFLQMSNAEYQMVVVVYDSSNKSLCSQSKSS